MEAIGIRTATEADLDQIARVETTCFPPAEACSREAFAARLAAYPDHFWLACDGDDIVSFVNGMATDEPDLVDAMFEDASMHDAGGSWLMVLSVATLPAHRGEGLAGSLVERAIADTRALGRRGAVLTCKERLVGYYAQFGFVDEGITDKSTHGGAFWHQMRLTF